MSNSSCTSILLDSDCEEELSRKVIASRKRRLSSCLPDDDDRPEEVSNILTDHVGYDSASRCVRRCLDTVLCVLREEQR